MTKFQEKEMMKKTPFAKSSWYDVLINYIPEPNKRTHVGVKKKITSLFKTNKIKDFNNATYANNAYKTERTKKSEKKKSKDDKIRNVGNLFKVKIVK